MTHLNTIETGCVFLSSKMGQPISWTTVTSWPITATISACLCRSNEWQTIRNHAVITGTDQGGENCGALLLPTVCIMRTVITAMRDLPNSLGEAAQDESLCSGSWRKSSLVLKSHHGSDFVCHVRGGC